MYDRLAVVPQNNVSTSISSTAPGADGNYLDAAAGLKPTTGPLKSTRIVVGNVKASKQASKDLGRDIAVWDTYSCTDKPSFNCKAGTTPLAGTDDRVAFDSNTGATVAWKGTRHEAGGKTTSPFAFEGQYFKFPFGTEKKAYKFWDDSLQTATDAKYVGRGKVKGLTVYKFEQTIAPTKTGTIDVPGDLVGSKEPTVAADQIYSNVRTFSVEPITGVIVVGGEDQDSFLEVNGVRKLTTTQAKLVYTDANTSQTVDTYKSKATLLGAVKTGVPLFGGILGLLLLLLGAWTKFGSNGSSDGSRKVTPARMNLRTQHN